MSVREVVTVYKRNSGTVRDQNCCLSEFPDGVGNLSRVTGRRAILTPDNEGAQKENIESIVWRNREFPSVDISNFFVRSHPSSFKYSGCPMHSFSMIPMGPRLRSLYAT